MNEPRRWREAGAGPDAVRDLLLRAEKTPAMTREQLTRSRKRITRFGAAGVGVGTLAWLHGAALGAGLGAATVVGAEIAQHYSETRNRPRVHAVDDAGARPRPRGSLGASEEAVAPTPSEAASSTPPKEPEAIAAPAPSTRATAAPRASEPSTTQVPSTDSLAEEAALLERARASLRNAPADALALAETHAVRFPRGKLSIEREMVIVDALRRQGRKDEAKARGDALLERGRGSLYEERIRKLLRETR